MLKVPLGEQDMRPVLEVLMGEQDMRPVLKVPPGEQDRLSVLQEMSPAERCESAALRGLQQLQLDIERLQREMERMQRVHQLEKVEMQRTFQMEKEEMQRTHQLKIDMQRVRQQEEEKKLEGSSGMSWKEKGIGCGSSAVPGLTGLAKSTHGCTATEDRTESLSLGAKGYPLM